MAPCGMERCPEAVETRVGEYLDPKSLGRMGLVGRRYGALQSVEESRTDRYYFAGAWTKLLLGAYGRMAAISTGQRYARNEYVAVRRRQGDAMRWRMWEFSQEEDLFGQGTRLLGCRLGGVDSVVFNVSSEGVIDWGGIVRDAFKTGTEVEPRLEIFLDLQLTQNRRHNIYQIQADRCVSSGDGTKVLVVGFDGCLIYDMITHQVREASTIEYSEAASLDVIDGRFAVLFGGVDPDGTALDWCCYLDLLGDPTLTWQDVEPGEVSEDLARHEHATSVVGTRLIVAGGRSGQNLRNDFWILDSDTWTWQCILCHSFIEIGGVSLTRAQMFRRKTWTVASYWRRGVPAMSLDEPSSRRARGESSGFVRATLFAKQGPRPDLLELILAGDPGVARVWVYFEPEANLPCCFRYELIAPSFVNTHRFDAKYSWLGSILLEYGATDFLGRPCASKARWLDASAVYRPDAEARGCAGENVPVWVNAQARLSDAPDSLVLTDAVSGGILVFSTTTPSNPGGSSSGPVLRRSPRRHLSSTPAMVPVALQLEVLRWHGHCPYVFNPPNHTPAKRPLYHTPPRRSPRLRDLSAARPRRTFE